MTVCYMHFSSPRTSGGKILHFSIILEYIKKKFIYENGFYHPGKKVSFYTRHFRYPFSNFLLQVISIYEVNWAEIWLYMLERGLQSKMNLQSLKGSLRIYKDRLVLTRLNSLREGPSGQMELEIYIHSLAATNHST